MISYIALFISITAFFLFLWVNSRIYKASGDVSNYAENLQAFKGAFDNLNSDVSDMARRLHGLEKELSSQIEKTQNQLKKHQSFMENITAASTADQESQPQKSNVILDRIQEGKSPHDIAREFGIPIGEVELMKNLKQFKT